MASKAVSIYAGPVSQKRGKKQQRNKLPQPQPQSEETVASVEVNSSVSNPVGLLQEISQHRLWPLPSYAFECINGDNPSRRQFDCTVKLQSHTSRGVGRSKQLAKREAARAMLQLVENCPDSSCQCQQSIESDKKRQTTSPVTTPVKSTTPTPTPSPLDETAFQELRSSKRLQSAARAGGEVGGLFRGVKNRKAGAALPPLETPATTAGPSCASDQLLDLSRQHRFGVQFLDASSGPDATSNGKHRAVVKLSTMPTIVAVGNGANSVAAREQACRAAMEYLCSLTRESAGTAAGKKA